MVQKKDYLIGAFIGLLTGFLAFFIFSFLDIDFKFKKIIFFIAVPILWAVGIAIAGFLSKWFSFFNQFGKFAAVGFLNSSIDFSILNLVSFATGITAGIFVGWINVPGFLFATLNGYLWNKFWVFKKTGDKVFEDFPKFFGVTIIGLLINSSIIVLLTTFFVPIGVSKEIWLNLSKVAATATALLWNFIGYKFIAFKKYV